MRSIRSVVLLLSMLPAAAVMPTASTAQILGIGVSITIAPPELPVYEQPPLPAPGYMWTPGYWSYGPDGYFWVPGTWVEPPSVGVLWTPGYWGWRDGAYAWGVYEDVADVGRFVETFTIDSWLEQPTLRIYDAAQLAERVSDLGASIVIVETERRSPHDVD